MKVRCIHGYFIFEATKTSQISDFISYTGLELVSVGNHYTFEALAETPEFSLPLLPFLGVPATKSIEGKPWEVFEENKLVFDFQKGLVVPILSVTQVVNLEQVGNNFYAPGLILPGSLTKRGARIKSYETWFSRDSLSWLYSEVEYV